MSYKTFKEKINDKTFIKEFQGDFGIGNRMALPKIKSVVVNVGIGRIVTQNAKPEELIKKISAELAAITGQKPVETKAKKAIASFKTRMGMTLGIKVTLHGQKMYDFLDRAINMAFPRTRDFRGLNNSGVDEAGNLTIGIKDHTVFPEATADAAHTFSFEFTTVVSGSDRKKSLEFFKRLGFPLRALSASGASGNK